VLINLSNSEEGGDHLSEALFKVKILNTWDILGVTSWLSRLLYLLYWLRFWLFLSLRIGARSLSLCFLFLLDFRVNSVHDRLFFFFGELHIFAFL